MEANTKFDTDALSAYTYNYEIARLESLLLSKPDHSATTLIICGMIESAITEAYVEMAHRFPNDFAV